MFTTVRVGCRVSFRGAEGKPVYVQTNAFVATLKPSPRAVRSEVRQLGSGAHLLVLAHPKTTNGMDFSTRNLEINGHIPAKDLARHVHMSVINAHFPTRNEHFTTRCFHVLRRHTQKIEPTDGVSWQASSQTRRLGKCFGITLDFSVVGCIVVSQRLVGCG